jgi:two-component system nitrogen regulation sensor histidine kinase NtrY
MVSRSIEKITQINLIRKFTIYLKNFLKIIRQNKFNSFVLCFALISFAFTYWILITLQTANEKINKVLPLLYFDIFLLLLLIVGIVRKIVIIWSRYKDKKTGSKLHIRLATIFCLLSAVPAGTVAIFSNVLFNVGIKSWFNKPVKSAIQEASEVSEAYLREHQKMIKNDALGMTLILRPQISQLLKDPELFSKILDMESESRNLGEILIFNGFGEIINRSYLTFALGFERINDIDFANASKGEIVIYKMQDRVRALIKLDKETDTYLFIGKLVDKDVLNYLKRTRNAVEDYRILETQSTDLQIIFALFLAVLGILVLLISAWMGLSLANALFLPISRLIEASEAVSSGDLSVQIVQKPLNNEVDNLVKAFNNMVNKLKKQNAEIAFNQKKAAWSDIARKIAHEIKNPLTPIQLSAERLKKKYSNSITNDYETFNTCIDTIIRQVSNIESLVTEFSSFARMPEPKISKNNLVLICNNAIDLQKQAYPAIAFSLICDHNEISWECDNQQIYQVLTNLLQNSLNSVIENKIMNPKITISLLHETNKLSIIVEDNGTGFPKGDRSLLIEPYYTTRNKGTGLGLAIVSKIVTDHGGTLKFSDSVTLGGAKVILEFNDLKK